MTPERLGQVQDLYHAALQRASGERAAYLAGACREDSELLREVESLLKQGSAGPLERPALEVAASLLKTNSGLSAGSRLGPYEILAPIGKGGMGEVYRASDTRLSRNVAIKISASQFNRRFASEARAISALNHPHICTLYDVGPDYLVMELVEGETLATWLKRGALPLAKVFEYGLQTAEALGEAHAKNITHRDLKPGNIMIAKMGVNRTGIKVLDFGLAKTGGEALTETSAIMGTPAYMAPEQRRGERADARSDIFSFGLVLYEMATGKQVPQGQPAQLDSLPERLAHVVARCLEEDPDDRWQTARDVRAELEWAAKPALAVASVPPAWARRRWLWPSVAAATTLAAFSIAVLWLRQPPPLDLSAYRYRPFAFTSGREAAGRWSPDAKSVAFLQGTHLMVQPADGAVPTQLAAQANRPIAWSPDGNRIYFSGHGGIQAVSRAGGQPELVLAGNAYFDLSPDGNALAVWRARKSPEGNVRGSVWISSPPGAEPREYSPAPFAVREDISPVHLRFSPDGKLLYLAMFTERSPETWLLPFPAGSGPPRRLFRDVPWFGPPTASWMPDSRRLVISGGKTSLHQFSLWLGDVQKETLTKLTTGSEPEMYPSVSPDGRRLLFTRLSESTDIVELPLDGSPIRKLLATSQDEFGPGWSPKGGEFAYLTRRNGGFELWVHSSPGDRDRPLVTAAEFPGVQLLANPVYSPDGTRVAYVALSPPDPRIPIGFQGIFISPAAGGTPTSLASGFAPSWSPDGASIAFIWGKPNGEKVLATLLLGSNQPPIEIPGVQCTSPPQWSPSGEFIVCGTEPSGPALVSPADGKVKRTLPHTGSVVLAWSKDSKTIYGLTYKNGRPTLVALDVHTSTVRTVAEYEPEQLNPYSQLDFSLQLSLSPDGKSLALGTGTTKAAIWILEGFPK